MPRTARIASLAASSNGWLWTYFLSLSAFAWAATSGPWRLSQ
jgi:hypothetical protein